MDAIQGMGMSAPLNPFQKVGCAVALVGLAAAAVGAIGLAMRIWVSWPPALPKSLLATGAPLLIAGGICICRPGRRPPAQQQVVQPRPLPDDQALRARMMEAVREHPRSAEYEQLADQRWGHLDPTERIRIELEEAIRLFDELRAQHKNWDTTCVFLFEQARRVVDLCRALDHPSTEADTEVQARIALLRVISTSCEKDAMFSWIWSRFFGLTTADYFTMNPNERMRLELQRWAAIFLDTSWSRNRPELLAETRVKVLQALSKFWGQVDPELDPQVAQFYVDWLHELSADQVRRVYSTATTHSYGTQEQHLSNTGVRRDQMVLQVLTLLPPDHAHRPVWAQCTVDCAGLQLATRQQAAQIAGLPDPGLR